GPYLPLTPLSPLAGSNPSCQHIDYYTLDYSEHTDLLLLPHLLVEPYGVLCPTRCAHTCQVARCYRMPNQLIRIERIYLSRFVDSIRSVDSSKLLPTDLEIVPEIGVWR
ncbi:hypothetical protein T310_9323, partial [Rasamsonia emersonii CBS 393.64]